MHKQYINGLFVALLLGMSLAFADSDEPPLFVEVGGNNVGNCDAANAPCQSISYALQRVGKNGRIFVAPGTYELASVEDIFYLLSNAIEVRGGYPEGTSTLVGVPHQYATELAAKGFSVIADSKGLDAEQEKRQLALVKTQTALQQNATLTICNGGMAGVYPCNNVDLLSHVSDRTPGSRGADIWGFVDLNSQREYALVGYSSGTSVFDVTDAENPIEVGFVNGQNTTWRDIKVHQFFNNADNRWNAYAYVTADNASDGLVIIDLTQLPHRISQVAYASDFADAHNVFLTDTDLSTGLSMSGNPPSLILAGANNSDGRFRIYSLADPASPSFVAAPSTPAGQAGNDRLYMHDAASMLVTDTRKDTQCVSAGGSPHCEILFDFNESTVDIWDMTNTTNPVRLSQTPYTNARYTHSGWWSEDQQFLFVQDELDERDNGLNTTLRVFSIADLTSPALVGSWVGPTRAIDHNGFVRGNRYYMSNYSRGLSILDITAAAAPTLVGRFDTFPSSDGAGFPGNWGVYPYLPSGNIALSDIDTGFYMVADNTLSVPQGSLSFSQASFSGEEALALNIDVQRLGGAQGAVSAAWEVVGATATADDLTTLRGTLNWADGDTTSKTIDVAPINDGVAEGLERFIIRLIAPTGGATLSSANIASGYISDPASVSSVEFTRAVVSVAERDFGKAVVVVRRNESGVGAVSVDFSLGNLDATFGSDFSGADSGTLSWADGDANAKTIEFTIADDGTGEADEFFELTLSNPTAASIGNNATIRVNVLDGTGTNSAPNSVAGGNQTVDSGDAVTLDGSGSNDPNGDTLTYRWTQTMGPGVTINGNDTATADFVAPSVTSDALLGFQLQVTDPGGQTDSSTASVTVVAPTTGVVGGGSSSGGGGSISQWLIALLLAGGALRLANQMLVRRGATLRSFAHDRDLLK